MAGVALTAGACGPAQVVSEPVEVAGAGTHEGTAYFAEIRRESVVGGESATQVTYLVACDVTKEPPRCKRYEQAWVGRRQQPNKDASQADDRPRDDSGGEKRDEGMPGAF